MIQYQQSMEVGIVNNKQSATLLTSIMASTMDLCYNGGMVLWSINDQVHITYGTYQLWRYYWVA